MCVCVERGGLILISRPERPHYWLHYARASWGRCLGQTSQFDDPSSQQGRAQQTPWLQLSAGSVHPVSIDCWLEWPVGLIHASHAWSPPGIIFKMTRRLVEHRAEVRKLLLFYFYFFSTWSWKIITYLLFYFFSTWSWKIITYLRFYFFSTYKTAVTTVN